MQKGMLAEGPNQMAAATAAAQARIDSTSRTKPRSTAISVETITTTATATSTQKMFRPCIDSNITTPLVRAPVFRSHLRSVIQISVAHLAKRKAGRRGL